MQTTPRRFVFCHHLLSVLLLPAVVALGQTSAVPNSEEIIPLDRVVVTGSHLGVPTDAVPITTISSTAVERGGVTNNLLEVLRKQMPAFSGSGNIGFSNASTSNVNTYGGARLSLHTLPTLVLVNGRRVATNGANARGGTNFVDVSQIPLAAIERIEVLTDGASAIYGSDAIGGVVNVVMKPAFNGSAAGGRYAFSTEKGDYSERSAYFTAGASSGRVSLVVTGNYSKTKPLYQGDRPFSSWAGSGSGFISGVVGTTILSPSLSSPRERNPTGSAATATSMTPLVSNGTYVARDPATDQENFAPYVTLLLGQEQYSTYGGVTVKVFDDRLVAFGDVMYSDTKSQSQLAAQGVNFNGTTTSTSSVPARSPYNPTTAAVGNVQFRYLPAPRKYLSEAEQMRLVGGLRGKLGSRWDWESAYTHSRSKLVAEIENVLFAPNLDFAVRGGYDAAGNEVVGGAYSRVFTAFTAPAGLTQAQLAAARTPANTVVQPALDPFARASAVDTASLANVLGTSRADFESTLRAVDVVVRGRPFDLPAGAIGIALGGDYRSEELIGVPDENSRSTGGTSSRWSGGSVFDPFERSRHIKSYFGELRVPLTSATWNVPGAHALDVTAAYRAEDYSDAGKSTVPKVGLRWQPLDEQLTFRATYGEGFSAPTPYAQFGPILEGSSGNISSALGFGDGVVRTVRTRTGANANLRPIESESRSVGFVLTPKAVRGLRVAVDYYDVEMTNLVGTAGTATILQSVEQLGSASPYISQVALNAFPGDDGAVAITTPGELSAYVRANNSPNTIFVADTRRNHSAAILRCVDIDFSYAFPVSSAGEFEVATRGTFFLDDKVQSLPTESYHEYAGLVTSAEGTVPDYRFYSTANWRKGAWEIGLANTYIAGVDDLGAGGGTYAQSSVLRRIPVSSYTTWDATIAWIFKPAKSANNSDGDAFVAKLRVGVNNLGNKMPPLAQQAYAAPSPNVDASTYSPIGRLYYVSADFKF